MKIHPSLKLLAVLLIIVLPASCSPLPASSIPASPFPATETIALSASPTLTQVPSATVLPTAMGTAALTATPLPTLMTPIAELKARVTADRLSCRYGPGPEYLYLYGLRRDANIVLMGRTGYSNWVWVKGKNPCWLNASFIEIKGDMNSLPITYPEPARLPRSPFYGPTTVLSAERDGESLTVTWLEIPLRAGDQEDESMLHYIVESWRCENGRLIFDPLATNDTSITFIDQPGCSEPSHGRIFVQEKHGFAGPAEIPWPK